MTRGGGVCVSVFLLARAYELIKQLCGGGFGVDTQTDGPTTTNQTQFTVLPTWIYVKTYRT